MSLGRTITVAATLALVSCVSYQDIRAKPPYESKIVRGEAETLSECVLNAFALRYSRTTLTEDSLTFTKMSEGTTIHLAANVAQGNTYWWDAAFVPLANGTVRVELRPYGISIWGKPNYPSDIWQQILSCQH
jgi:hypothetical protein